MHPLTHSLSTTLSNLFVRLHRNARPLITFSSAGLLATGSASAHREQRCHLHRRGASPRSRRQRMRLPHAGGAATSTAGAPRRSPCKQSMCAPWAVLLPPPQGRLAAGDRTPYRCSRAATRQDHAAAHPLASPSPLRGIELPTSVKLHVEPISHPSR
jgi:hypothetical protein